MTLVNVDEQACVANMMVKVKAAVSSKSNEERRLTKIWMPEVPRWGENEVKVGIGRGSGAGKVDCATSSAREE